MARGAKVGEVIGLDPSRIFLAKARELSAGIPKLQFEEGDARNLPYGDDNFDMVLFHTTLSHVPTPEKPLLKLFVSSVRTDTS